MRWKARWFPCWKTGPADCEIVVALDQPYSDPYELKDEVRFVAATVSSLLGRTGQCGAERDAGPLRAFAGRRLPGIRRLDRRGACPLRRSPGGVGRAVDRRYRRSPDASWAPELAIGRAGPAIWSDMAGRGTPSRRRRRSSVPAASAPFIERPPWISSAGLATSWECRRPTSIWP